jgi:hypothetical protein
VPRCIPRKHEEARGERIKKLLQENWNLGPVNARNLNKLS